MHFVKVCIKHFQLVIGVEASKKMAETDLVRIEKYKSVIIKVGTAKQMDPAVIAAIISRESRAGSRPEGWVGATMAMALASCR